MRGFLRSPRSVGAIAPSSPWLVNALLDAAQINQVQTLVEFGCGTGVVTRGIIRRLRPNAKLVGFELDEHFAAALRNRITDSRATILTASAADAPQHLAKMGLHSVDCIVSSLPLTSLPRPVTHRILQAAESLLRPGGLFVTYQFSGVVRPLLHRYFPQTEADQLVLRNIPPAIVFVCPKEGHIPQRKAAAPQLAVR